MKKEDKVLYLDNVFIKSVETSEDGIESIFIEGYASTTDIDRHGDVVPSSVWEAGMKDYLNNPIILAHHNYRQPIGRMTEHKIDSKGLWIKARISSAAEDVYKLIKDGLMTAFSIGFRILDAEYNSAAEVFLIKELSLYEISVVAVPANQNTLFNLSKSFKTDEEFKSFKMQFAAPAESAKGLESKEDANSNSPKGLDMTPEEIQKMLDAAAAKAAKEAAEAMNAAAVQKAAEEKAAAEAAAALDARIKAAVEVTQSGAEKLIADLQKRLDEQADSTKSIVTGLEAALKEKADEIAAIQKSKMTFGQGTSGNEYADREKAVLLAKMAGKSLEGTKFGRDLVEKVGAHVPSATWELEVGLNMESEVRRRLVVAPTLRNIPMQTNVMTLPINPEAGYATWVTNAQFGDQTGLSSGTAQTHAATAITINAYKLATKEYMALEEEEDSLIALMPMVRDAIIRRISKSVDKAFLLGAGSGADPVTGLVTTDSASAVSHAVASATTVANLRALRKDLGAWGLNPADLVYIVSTEVYYDLLDDANFLTVDKIGDRATLLTGQIGAIGNTPVIVSGEFAAKAAGAAGAICYAPANFVVGNQRGLRIDSDTEVVNQRRVLVASLRTGLQRLTNNLGLGVSALRFTP